MVTKTCGEVFFSAAQRDACIQVVQNNARIDLLPAVVACGQAITGTSDRLTCVNQAATVQADLRDPAQVRSMVDEAASALGGIDVLVNNAGISPKGDGGARLGTLDTALEIWQNVFLAPCIETGVNLDVIELSPI